MGIPDQLNCLLRNLYAGQEVTVRTGQGKTDWFQIGKGVHQGCMLSPCLFNSHAEWKWKWSRSVVSPTLRDPLGYILPGSSVHGIFQARVLEWVAISRLNEVQAEIKIARRNISLRYADDTTLMTVSEEELKSLLMKVKEESEKSWLKTQHWNNEDHGIRSRHLMANRWGNNGNSERLYFGGPPNHCR